MLILKSNSENRGKQVSCSILPFFNFNKKALARILRVILLPLFGLMLQNIVFAQENLSKQDSVSTENNLIGTWKGQVNQEGWGVYQVTITIERLKPQQYAGTINFSEGLTCGGLLTFQRQKACIFQFQATINSGSGCVRTTYIELWFNEDGTLQYETHKSLQPRAIATIQRE